MMAGASTCLDECQHGINGGSPAAETSEFSEVNDSAYVNYIRLSRCPLEAFSSAAVMCFGAVVVFMNAHAFSVDKSLRL